MRGPACFRINRMSLPSKGKTSRNVLAFTGNNVDFTSVALSNHTGSYSGPGTGGANTIVQANLLEGTYYNYEGKTGKVLTGSFGSRLFVRFKIKWSSDFDFCRGMKILRVTAADAVSQTNYFDYLLVMQDAGPSANSTALTDNAQLLAQRNAGSNWGSFSFSPVREQWYDIQCELKIESSDGAGDGACNIWIDEVSKLAYTGNLGHSATGYYSNMESITIGGWYSNGTSDPNPSSGISWQMKDFYYSSSLIVPT